ncbi:hypothetical protein [Bosea sp. ANAM02]|uniref:hypothetical protein n=1 Tax=Bosea sp. ANAM02 TaxID=2020412 RepID=UPI00140EFABD|nr:hypothetical protein [Bosea sp. ANAM02]BCB21153.1 hypothetical protein OCUBac02_40470 [Bosea sp. ANAM02]
MERVRARASKNIGNPVWSLLEGLWQDLGRQAQSVLAFHQQGRPGAAHERRAAQEIVKLTTSVEPKEAIETVLAMVMMWDQEPRRFRSNEGFRSQLVRRVRALADMNIGVYFDDSSGRSKRVYRDLPPRVVKTMADWIIKVLGGPALQIARLEVRDREAEDRRRQELQDALADLK